MAERRSQTTDDDEPPKRRTEPATYTVQPHDTLPSIAERYGHAGEWQVLRDANVDIILDANTLFIGSVLVLPEGWSD